MRFTAPALGALLLVLVPALLGAAAPDEGSSRDDYARMRKQAQEKRQQAQTLKKQEKGMLKQIQQVERNIAATRNQVQQYQRNEERLTRDIGVVQGDLSRTRVARSMTQQQLARRLRAAYRFSQDRALEFLFSSQSFSDLDLRMKFVGLIGRGEEHLVGHLGQQAESIDVARTVLEDKRTAVARVKVAKEQERKKLEGLRVQRRKAVSDVQASRVSYEMAAAELERAAQKLKKFLDELERRRQEQERLRAQRGEKVPEMVFGHGRGSLPWPARGGVMESFGDNRNPKFGTVTRNNGIDIGAAEGADVHAVESGTVEWADWYEGYGQMVLLGHGGMYTLYGNLGQILVTPQQRVLQGQVIGKVGDTGSLNGPKLHFEVRKGKTAVDPMDWLK